MKKWLLIPLILLVFLPGKAQQDPMYSMYMFNGLALNPAYAGSRDRASFTLFGREQWMGFPGAPRTQSFTMHAPTADLHHGWGVSIVNDEAGVTKNFLANFTYAYRIHLGEHSRLAFGLQGGMDYYRVALSEVETWDNNDPAYLQGDFTKVLPNAGAGIYFNSRYFYAGFSSPNFLPSRIYDPYYETLEGIRQPHYFLTSGIVIPLGKSIKLKPSFLLKYTQNAPVSIDINGAILFHDVLWLGFSYRPQQAMIYMAEINITPGFRIGYAYDQVLTDLSNYSDGSHELMIGIDLGMKKKKIISPRLF